ncbi:glycosyltransferase family 4 protein [Methanofollis ethanolicus]|uniref:glycosyltransferase family 4 protein n=1 Tax=Methanofollis ethanolicus TaxID=488124 RepID=UPI00082A2A34|nr:glycosyltransferase family 4 protein [Methanofollis ethanolicus]
MKVAFVIPWYGDIPGGAEAACRDTALHLARAGIEVDVLTTCVKEFLSDWNTNYYREGVYHEDGIVVRRFPVRKRDTKRFDAVNFKLINNRIVTPAEEGVFLREMIHSEKLYSYVAENGENYDFLLFIPYMFGTTVSGSQIHPEKSILIPCLHDESYAHMGIYRSMFRNVGRIIYLSEQERRIAHQIYEITGKEYTLGTGVDTGIESDPQRFRDTYGIKDPFILYAGRRDAGKNVDQLISFFCDYKERHGTGLKLILIGKGVSPVPIEHRKDIIDLGFVPVQDKYDAYGAATLFCLPSLNESFSLVIMEAWLCMAPVLVHGRCTVTRSHCIRSNGGLYYNDYDEFEACLSFILQNPHISDLMAQNGKKYVIENYGWNTVVSEYIRLFYER